MSSVVRLSVERMEIPTYVLGPDSPYPTLMLSGEHGYYPYSNRLDIRTESKPVQHRVVILENDYVQAVILPDMGGRLYRLFDKVARQDTFMVPPSVKYQNISNRGAWVAGGIELNFGHRGHNVSTVNPVSWTTRTEADGSVSVFVGAVVRPSEARWSVRYNLKPSRSAIEMKITTMAPPVLPGLMYWWSNSAVVVGEQSKFYYFGHQGAGWARHSWPITDGLDYTWYRNRVFGGDMFLQDPHRDYMGFYDFERHHGLAQTANRFLAPGQKYFTWGCDPRGRYWDLLLSDSEQTYCEIQRGRLETQGVTERIPPMSTDGWTETWMPINKTEGFGGVDNDVVVAVARQEGNKAATVRVLSAVPCHDLRVEALCGEKRLASWTVEQMNPGVPACHQVDLDKDQVCDHVRVMGPDGKVLIDWTEFQYKNEDWVKLPKAFDEATASLEELFIEAERRRFEVWPHYLESSISLHNKILAKDPGHTGSLWAMAEIDLWRGQFARAEERIRQALRRKSLDANLQTTLGWTLIYLGRPEEAFAAFMTASRYEPGRKNGLCGAVSAMLMAGQFAEADKIADELITQYPKDRWALLMKVMTTRKIGRKQCAAERVAELLADDPLWNRATAEALLLGVPTNLADGKRKLADDSVTAAGSYLELGLWADAEVILSQDESDEAFSPAIRLSHLLYARHKMGDKAGVKAALKDLRTAPVGHANPWSIASLVVLGELATEYPEESLVQAMFGTILASRGRLDEALTAWKKAAELGLEQAVVYRNLAVVQAHLKDHEAAVADYRKAWKLGKGDLNLFAEVDRYFASQGLHKDRDRMYQQLSSDTKAQSHAALRRVPQLLDMERYDEALEELKLRTFLSGEGGERLPHVFFAEACLGKAVGLMNEGRWKEAEVVISNALTYPRNLNVGKHSTRPGEATLRYMLGLIAEQTGKAEEAREHFLAAASEAHNDGEPAQAFEMLAWQALGCWAKGRELVGKFDRMGRGEVPVDEFTIWAHGRNCMKVGVGFARLAKGRPAETREIWRKVLEEERDARSIRPLLLMSDELLGLIYRGNEAFIKHVHEEVRQQVARFTDNGSGGNGQAGPRNGDGKVKASGKRPGGKKVRG